MTTTLHQAVHGTATRGTRTGPAVPAAHGGTLIATLASTAAR